MEATQSEHNRRNNGRKEKCNAFTGNLNESDCDASLECLEENHSIVDRLSGVSCVSMQCRSPFN